MAAALYGPDGFYRRPAGPAAHFRTSVSASPMFAEALLSLATQVHEGLGRPSDFTIVDVGAGRGELLGQLADLAPTDFGLVGVDVVDRPYGLPERVRWRRGLAQLETVPAGLVVANEWLDNIPIDVVENGRLVEVDASGEERPGQPPGAKDQEWIDRWAPGFARVEVGRSRDEAWAQALGKLENGVAVAIDYRLDPERQRFTTLTGFRNGRQVRPVPDGSCDLTAHVLLESCADAVEAGFGDPVMLDQRQALHALGVSGGRPPIDLAGADPAGYLRALSRAGEAAELTDPGGLGGFWWLLQSRGAELPVQGRLG
jgi:SAM-dependent MidA family methyltransferase